MKELKQKRDCLIAERNNLENNLPILNAAWRNAPSNYSPIGNMIGSPERREAMEQYSSAECRLRAIPGELEKIDRKLDYLDSLAKANQHKIESLHTMFKASEEIIVLQNTQSQLRERCEAIQSESAKALKNAQTAEQNAARLYAESIAGNDIEVEKNANENFQNTAKQLSIAGEQFRRQELIHTALQQELAAIDIKIKSIKASSDDAKNKALQAIEILLNEEWNKATNRLVAIGARIVSACRQKGVMNNGLSKLQIPRFGPFANTLDHSDLEHAGLNISFEDLAKQ